MSESDRRPMRSARRSCSLFVFELSVFALSSCFASAVSAIFPSPRSRRFQESRAIVRRDDLHRNGRDVRSIGANDKGMPFGRLQEVEWSLCAFGLGVSPEPCHGKRTLGGTTL